MTDEEMAQFKDWNNALLDEMNRVADIKSKAIGGVGYMIDAAVPFRLGWSPARAARALLHMDHKDHQTLANLMQESTNQPTDAGRDQR